MLATQQRKFMIKFSDIDIQHKILKNKLLLSFKNALKQNQFVGGKNISEFEKKFSNLLDIKYCLGVANGTDALEIAIKSLKLKKNSEVLVPASTWISTAEAVVQNNLKVKFVQGENLNTKITFKEDIKEKKTYFGLGFDIHRLIKGKKLYLGGIKIPYHSGLKGHSDGDVIIHSIIDSILGAMRKKDIGTFFPDNSNKFKNIRSTKMLKPIIELLNLNNYHINNLDINLICEKPKISKYRDKIINSLSNLLDLNKNLINLKGKTTEKLGLIGKEKAIACEVICSISK